MISHEPTQHAASAGVSSTQRLNPGDELKDLANRVFADNPRQRDYLIASSIDILSQGINLTNTKPQVRTGLVLGYVQSGKTTSFEAVSALARDNGYQLIILIAGRNNLLLEQSVSRIARDLNINDADRSRRWLQLKNPAKRQANELHSALDSWRDPATPEYLRRTTICCILKHQTHIGNLVDLLDSYRTKVPTLAHHLNVLVIDDEADQASLDISLKPNEASAIFVQISRLRELLLRHTYLQYTATPQALLLVSRTNILSPDFSYILEPGDDYVGSQELLNNHSDQFVSISDDDTEQDKDSTIDISDSLQEALRSFLIGVSAGLIAAKNAGNRSMLVHPHHLKDVHQRYVIKIRHLLSTWEDILVSPTSESGRGFLRDEFESTYDAMRASSGGTKLPSFEVIWKGVRHALRETQVVEVNTRHKRSTPEIEWVKYYPWILVGGEVMSRGYTLEGLTVTHLARPVGTGQADTIQQRARFLGYRKDYLEYCRIFVTADTRRAFEAYVEHEEHLRRELVALYSRGVALEDWLRRFVLSDDMKPCRKAVIGMMLARPSTKTNWTRLGRIAGTQNANSQLAIDWDKRWTDIADPLGERDHRGVDLYGNAFVSHVPLSDVIEWLQADEQVRSYPSSMDFLSLMAMLGELEQMCDGQTCRVYNMADGAPRERDTRANGVIKSLFQGRGSTRSAQAGYPGDSNICAEDQVTLQIHHIRPINAGERLVEIDNSVGKGRTAPVLAVRVPDTLVTKVSEDLLVEVSSTSTTEQTDAHDR